MLETVFSEDFRGEQFPQFLQFLLEQFMYLETLFSYTHKVSWDARCLNPRGRC